MRVASVRPLVLAVIVLGLIGPARAGDPNDATGFSSNHIFQEGGFGESIDLMSGSLKLSFPIGPGYQVGPSLSYQFTLYYDSHLWAYDQDKEWDATESRNLLADGRVAVTGCYGAGVRGHFGRVYRDYHDYDGTGTDPKEVWRLETPDGAQHYFGTESSLGGNNTSPFVTVDGSYIRMTRLGTTEGWSAELPDGTRWILDHVVGNPDTPTDTRADKGWYVSRIVDDLREPDFFGLPPVG